MQFYAVSPPAFRLYCTCAWECTADRQPSCQDELGVRMVTRSQTPALTNTTRSSARQQTGHKNVLNFVLQHDAQLQLLILSVAAALEIIPS